MIRLNENLIKKSFAQMVTNNTSTYSDSVLVTEWGTDKNINIGKFICEPENSRIFIPKGSAECVRVFGTVAGAQYVSAELRLVDEDNNRNRIFFNHQAQGNQYFMMNAWDRTYEIDSNKDYYLYLYMAGYNSKNFLMNSGFGNNATFIGIEQIK